MMNEKDTIRSLFDGCSPDEEQVHRMEREILATHRNGRKSVKKLRLMPAIAAVLMITVGITAIASAVPAIKRNFFPGVGLVEVDSMEETAPLYMMADQNCDEGTDFTCMYGVWYDNTAFIEIMTETRYDEMPAETLFGDIQAEMEIFSPKFVSSDKNGITWLSTYIINYTDVTWEKAAAGLPLGAYTIPFTRMPAEYQTYAVEDKGLHLELIPLTDDLTTFAMSISYLDERGEISIMAGSYDPRLKSANRENQTRDSYMKLIDADGNLYPLVRRRDNGEYIHIFSISEQPKAEIVGFRAEYLSFSNDFKLRGESYLFEVPMLADGESVDVNHDFVFCDGVTPGRILSVGYNTKLTGGQINRKMYFSMGYRSVLTEAVEKDGIWYWCRPEHTAEYDAYLEQFLIEDTRDPYEMTQLDPMGWIHMVNYDGPENTIEHMEHYISDGSDTITVAVASVNGIAWGDWNIDFDRDPTNG